ncbi:MAG: class I SAM-dependent methyltransferase [Glaciecola sp.]|nr:class I SAM-dependent methyltransferase [Glaciecola sp.]MDG1922524.1 class I SAM-dependent methyltransferase [Glaciecola sp.]
MSATPWQSYWQAHSTHNSFMHEYESSEGPYGEIDTYWQSMFNSFPKGAVIVDLGAGNGALSHLYSKHENSSLCKSWQNVDYAHITAPTLHPWITHTQADMHALPFADNSIDIVVSMYGVEYSDLSCTLAEVARVLKPNGQCVLVMHHSESIITKQSIITLEVINSLLQEPMLNGFTDVAMDNVDMLKHYCLQVLTKHLHQVPENAQEDVKLIGQNVYNILQSNDGFLGLIKQLNLLGQDLAAQAERLAQQIKAAQQVAQLQSIDFNSSFTHRKFSTLDFDESPIATTMIAVK